MTRKFTREYYTIEKILKDQGLKLNPDSEYSCDIWEIIYYLKECPEEYTIYDWIRDTLENYPDTFISVN